MDLKLLFYLMLMIVSIGKNQSLWLVAAKIVDSSDHCIWRANIAVPLV